LGRAATDTFFVLPRATGLGGVTAPPLAPAPWSAAWSAAAPAGCDPLPAPEVDSLVGETARRDGLDADLLRSVMKQESSFRPCAVSPKGALGLMQLMPSTAEQFGIEDPFDPSSNVDAGARFLKQLLGRYGGDVAKALGAYNAGPAKVDAAGGVPAIPETMDYVRQILSALPLR
jgi:soluble lytic murein transglycosylase-like protein